MWKPAPYDVFQDSSSRLWMAVPEGFELLGSSGEGMSGMPWLARYMRRLGNARELPELLHGHEGWRVYLEEGRAAWESWRNETQRRREKEMRETAEWFRERIAAHGRGFQSA